MSEQPELLLLPEVAKILRCGEEAVRLLAKQKRIKSITIGAGKKRESFRFRRAWVDEFIDSCANEPTNEPKPTPSKPLKGATLKRHSIMGIS